MNIKNTLLAGVAAIGMAQMASADVYYRVTGSSAFADASHTAILNVFAASGNSLTSYAYETSALTGSKVAIFKGTINGITGNVIVKTKFNGSELGIQATAHGDNITFLNDSVLPASGSTASVASSNETDVTAPSACHSDTWQSASRFAAGATVTVNGSPVTYTALTGFDGASGTVGVVPFKFFATSDAPFSNLTTAQGSALWGAGKIGLDAFTGLSADASKYVFATGRDIDSGTRLNAMLAIGLSANGAIKQYQPSTSANVQLTATPSGTANKLIPFPSGTINGVSVALYNNGYNSGGNMSKAIGCAATAFGGTTGVAAVIGYASAADCDSRIAANQNKELSLNGISLGNAGGNYKTVTALTGGLYTFWCYEHIYYSAATAADTTGIKTVADLIANQIKNTDATILLSNMTVSRLADQGTIAY